MHKEDIVEAIKLDKKSREAKINFVLPRGLGKVEVMTVKEEEILKVLK